MRGLKSSGGMTQCRGISPSTIATWVHSIPASPRIKDAVEEFTGVVSTSTSLTGCMVLHDHAYADVLIVSTTVGEAEKEHESVLIGEYTDFLVLLVALAPLNTFLKMVMPGTTTNPDKIHYIGAIHEKLGEMKDFLLTLHAFTGCDTDPSTYRKGKITPSKKVHTDKQFREVLRIFNDPQTSADGVTYDGVAFFPSLYGSKGKGDEDLEGDLHLPEQEATYDFEKDTYQHVVQHLRLALSEATVHKLYDFNAGVLS
ncbi:hypothetical protein PR048_001548 [Dryococelus australis]|uniref:Uncharacterized protein n=1 Tax=Dryococelus australis TaxID=614101 RepID=A0ABQ9IHN6_9NEOP|nr:hypothetical protein PR048_001548 [Dryococelus australis]